MFAIFCLKYRKNSLLLESFGDIIKIDHVSLHATTQLNVNLTNIWVVLIISIALSLFVEVYTSP